MRETKRGFRDRTEKKLSKIKFFGWHFLLLGLGCPHFPACDDLDVYMLAGERFHAEKLCSRLSSTEVQF